MWEASHKKAVVEIPLRIWNQIDKSHPDCDELFDRSYQIISVEEFFTLGLQYSAFYPDRDQRNGDCQSAHNWQSNIQFVKRIG
ncbi:MAG: hypothetical protein HC764_17790 [Pleurocapsa sp. CRU_1_2]|nr:hypothetical protein [Pleurocapsa sp. CRU_1_2]